MASSCCRRARCATGRPRLPIHGFARVHRTAIINLAHIERIERAGDDAFRVVLRGLAAPVPISRRHATRLRGLG